MCFLCFICYVLVYISNYVLVMLYMYDRWRKRRVDEKLINHSFQVRSGCVWEYPCLVDPCPVGQACAQDGFTGHTCSCPNPPCLSLPETGQQRTKNYICIYEKIISPASFLTPSNSHVCHTLLLSQPALSQAARNR